MQNSPGCVLLECPLIKLYSSREQVTIHVVKQVTIDLHRLPTMVCNHTTAYTLALYDYYLILLKISMDLNI